MTSRRLATTTWLACTIAVFFIPSSEVTLTRATDLDSQAATVIPLTALFGLASLVIGLIVLAFLGLKARRG